MRRLQGHNTKQLVMGFNPWSEASLCLGKQPSSALSISIYTETDPK